MASNVLIHHLSEPLNGAARAKFEINPADGNLVIDTLTGGAPVLACGELEYLEKQAVPARSISQGGGQVTLALTGGKVGQRWFRLPWAACNGATVWKVHLNPEISAEILANSSGGNIRLALAGMDVTRLSAETGGGNIEVALPEQSMDLVVSARTGAGNVTVDLGRGAAGRSVVGANSGAGNVEVRLPGGLAARLIAGSGLGKAVIDPCFQKVNATTYETPGYDLAADRVEITAKSGAGNVIVKIK